VATNFTAGEVAAIPDAAGEARKPPTEWAIFPAHNIENGRCSCGRADCSSPGKHPRTPNGFHDATSDPAQLETWWSKWPQANLAVATGPVNGIVVVDIDPAKGGRCVAPGD
jgi:hypothetical protein